MALVAQRRSDEVRPATGLDAYQCCRQVGSVGEQLFARELLPDDDATVLVERNQWNVVLPRSMPMEAICMR